MPRAVAGVGRELRTEAPMVLASWLEGAENWGGGSAGARLGKSWVTTMRVRWPVGGGSGGTDTSGGSLSRR